jgi:short-subunit dehydrogenase
MAKTPLNGLPIAITGASSGIGWSTAIACANAGMPVALGARRTDRLEELAAKIRAAGGRAIVRACDVDKPEDCRALIDATIAEFGSIYSVFANSGYGFEGMVHQSDDAAVRAIFETNFYGTLNTIWPALEHMQRAGRGHVLICSSCLSKISMPFFAAYSATKAAQDHFGRAMRHELRPLNIHVSTVHPIGTKTEFSSQVTVRTGVPGREATLPDTWKQSADYVAACIVRCLERPKGEVWPSVMARYVAALATAFPGLADAALNRKFAARIRQRLNTDRSV